MLDILNILLIDLYVFYKEARSYLLGFISLFRIFFMNYFSQYLINWLILIFGRQLGELFF